MHSFNMAVHGAMGLKWLPKQDLSTLHGGRKPRTEELRKRDILSDVQSFFDLIGYTSSFILKGKLIF